MPLPMDNENIVVEEEVLVPDFSERRDLTPEEVDARKKARARLEEMCRRDIEREVAGMV